MIGLGMISFQNSKGWRSDPIRQFNWVTFKMSERQGKYWICNDCADKRGFRPFKSGNTIILGLCGWCDRDDESGLTPLRDLKTADDLRADNVLAESGEDF